MNLTKMNIYNPLTRKGFEQPVSFIMEPAIESMYQELKKNRENLFKHKQLLSLSPVGLKNFTLEITGYKGTALYKIFHDNSLAVLGEVFLTDDEVEKFSVDLGEFLKDAYSNIPTSPVSTIVFAKGFYVLNQIVQETVFSFCRLLGFAVVKVLDEPEE